MNNTTSEQPEACSLCGGTGIVQRHPFILRCGCEAAAVESEGASEKREIAFDCSAWLGELEAALRLLRELETESFEQRTGPSQKWAVIEAAMRKAIASERRHSPNSDLSRSGDNPKG